MTPHTQIIRLARSGSLERAWAMMEQHGLLDAVGDVRSLTLQGRLVKDRAKRASGSERARLFGEAAALYAKAGAVAQGSYPLINAASLSLLAGQSGQSRTLAKQVLDALDANPDEAETPYWLGATRAEALLLLGQETEARAALREAIRKQPAAWEDHAATLGQFELLCEELGCDTAWLEQIRPPRSLHFAGIIHVADQDAAVQDRIAEWLEAENIGFGYGALAAGADIWIAEALLDRGAELHVLLPCDEATFRQQSVAAFGEQWLPRFDRLMGEASSVECLDFSQGPNPSAVTLAEAVAHGMALHNAQHVRSSTRRLRIIGASDDVVRWPEGAATLRAERLKSSQRGKRSCSCTMLVKTSEGIRYFTDIAEAHVALMQTASASAIDYLPVHGDGIPEVAHNRLDSMLECTDAGSINASLAGAFALLDHDPELAIENLGDMRWVGGMDPLYRITRP